MCYIILGMIRRTVSKFLLLVLLPLLASSLLGGCQLQSDAPLVTTGASQVLNLYGADPTTLDPALSNDMTSHGYVTQIFSGLVRLDDDLKPAPDIAERWELSDDGRTYTFYLRHGVKFHDSREVTAGDFKYSWQRAGERVTGSLTAATYLGDIVGMSDVLDGKTGEISGVRVIGDYTLEVTIDAPKAYFLSKLTYPTAFVVDRANVSPAGKWWHRPNGTGPFKLKELQEGSRIVLERNDDYYGERAKVGAVVFKILSGIPMNMYQNGEIDVAGVGLDYIDKVTDRSGEFYPDLMVVPELSLSYIVFNHTRPPFDDADIRRAFSRALDKEKLASLVFRDMVRPAGGILPPDMPGFNNDLSVLGYDVEQAKQLISRSSYGDVSRLPPITITTMGQGGLISQELEAVIYQWRQNLGVEVEVRQMEQDRFFTYLREEKDEMVYIGWVADYPHPQNFLDILFHSGAESNFGDYSNAGVDALLERAGTETDDELSLELYQQVEQALVDDAASLPLWFGESYILVKPYVKGYDLNPMGFVMLNRVSVEEH